MSLFDRQSSAFPSPTASAGSDTLSSSPPRRQQTASSNLSLDSAAAFMSESNGTDTLGSSDDSGGGLGGDDPNHPDHPDPPRLPIPSKLDPHSDARAVVRLLQCQQCSLPLRTPISLPCGNSLCRPCLPDFHRRENISYPTSSNRGEGFLCPFADCGQEHVVGDCAHDVVLAKVLERVGIEVARYRPLTSNTPTLLEERMPFRNGASGAVVDSSIATPTNHSAPGAETSRSRVLSGGRLLATFTMAELGELRYDAELTYTAVAGTGDAYGHLDRALLEHLKDVARGEMDCQVCYAMMLDPLTTPCGHTFCRKCVARMLDHSTGCPACRRPLHIPPGAPASYPSNKRLSKLLLALCPEMVATRAEQVEQEEMALRTLQGDALAEQHEIPLFVCTLAYPEMPTFLHVFEPRYRLMIRRAMESGSRRFGMVLHNSRGAPQGALGRAPFMQYGTLLYVENIQLLPDGRSIIETRGRHRFRVLEHGARDGYAVGRVERTHDVPLAEEEALEAAEVAAAAQHPPPPLPSGQPPLAALPTLELLRVGTDFVARMRAAAAPWLAANYLAAYGPMPDDPALFPYWFASVLPIAEQEKYRLLPTRSVRERLKITAGWVRRVEGMRG